MRQALAVLLGAAVVAAAVVTGSSASRTGGVFDYWVDVQFTGTGQGVRTFGVNTITETYSFEELYFAHVESRNGIVNYVDFPADLIGGDGFANFSGGGIKPCTATFEPEYFKAGASEGIRTWFGNQRSDIGNPGPDNTLVTAMANFGFVVGKPRSCTGGLTLWGAAAAPELHCVVTPEKGCTDSWSSAESPPCSTAYLTCDRGNAQMKFVATPTPIPPERLAESDGLFFFFDLPPLTPLWNWPPFPPPPPFFIPTGKTKPPAEDGEVDAQVWIAKQPLLIMKGPVKKGVQPKLPLRWSAVGVAAARRITKPTLLTTKLTFTPAKGKPFMLTTTSYLMPHPKAGTSSGGGGGIGGSTTPSITSVTFGGTATSPTFIVHGKNLGTRPAPSPAGHPSGQGGCPVIAGDNGYDYGTSLYVVSSKGWSGGRSRPSANETDCIDLVVTKFTPTEVSFHFGPFYAKYASKFPLAPGDQLQIVVNGETKTVTR